MTPRLIKYHLAKALGDPGTVGEHVVAVTIVGKRYLYPVLVTGIDNAG